MQQDSATAAELLTFLRAHDVAVVATVKGNHTAHAASVYYYAEDDLRFYFLTRNATPKFNNIKDNHSVAMVITDPDTLQTVQVEGSAEEVDYSHDYASTVKKLTDHLLDSGKEWANLPVNHIGSGDSGYYALMQVNPSWIRWTDYRNWDHSVKFEMTSDKSQNI